MSEQFILYQGGQGEITEKKSRFISYLFPVTSEEEALDYIHQIKKKHYDARHNCFAYVIGANHETERCSDDGEPSGTAGRPMLDVLLGEGIENAVAIVTRYFGGTLLGTGGLVRAYSSAVKEGLKNCVLMEKQFGYRLHVNTDYNDIGKIQYIARTKDLFELESQYGTDVNVTYLIPEHQIGAVEKEITEKTSGRADLDRGEKECYGIAQGQYVAIGGG